MCSVVGMPTTTKSRTKRLSPKSIYEQMFGTRYRRPGRPNVADGEEPLFPLGTAHPLVARVAQRRAFAVVHEESRGRLAEVYRQELAVLRRRDVEDVAEDVGVSLGEVAAS